MRGIGPDEPCVHIGQIVVDLHAFREHPHRTQGVDSVVRGVVLKLRLHDARCLESQASRDNQAARHQADLHATVVDRVHDLDRKVLNRGFRQVSRGGQFVGERAALDRVIRGQQFFTVAARVGRREGAVIDVRTDVFLRLTEGEREVLGRTNGLLFVLVVVDGLTGHDEAEAVGNGGIARRVALRGRIVLNSRALLLDRSQTEAGHQHVFLVSLVGGFEVEQVPILDGMLDVFFAPDSVQAGPQEFGNRASVDNASHD